MGGVIGFASKQDCVMDLFFGTDYHSHLGTKRGLGCVSCRRTDSTVPSTISRTLRSGASSNQDIEEMKGNMGIGAISDGDPQPLTVYSRQGDYAIATVGRINNKDEIVQELLKDRPSQFMSMSGGGINNTELVAALISTGRDIVDGIRIAQAKVEGSVTILVLTRGRALRGS